MIRQAHSYLAGAVSGAALIVVSVIVFLILLVSTQGFRDLPVVDLGRGESAAVAPARPASQRAPAVAGPAVARADAGDATADSGGVGTVTDDSRGTSTSPSSGSPGATVDSPAPAGTPISSTGRTGRSRSNPSGAAEGESSVSGTVAGAVNDTVTGVDRGLGGALGRTGAPGVVKGAVDGVAGPGSAVGQTVDQAGGAVRGLLGDDD